MITRPCTLIVAALFAALALSTQASAQADAFGIGTNAFAIDFVNIGNAGNAADTRTNTGSFGRGAVPYEYRIGKYEISQHQIDRATASGLSNVTAGAWTGSRPAANISWYEMAAFANWMNTSLGYQAAYNLTFTTNWSMSLWSSAEAWQLGGENLYRHKDAFYFLPSENEWYKAAYYNPVGTNYFLYTTGSDTAPSSVASGTNSGTVVAGRGEAAGPAAVDSAGGLSPYGTMGQGGNVWDLLETAFDGTNSSPSESRLQRAGRWGTSRLSGASDIRGEQDPSSSNSGGFGFRVASMSEAFRNNYWAPGEGGGGSGTWGAGSDDWSTAIGSQGTNSQNASGRLIFGNAAGTVTVSGTVSAVNGMRFETDGYAVVGGTSITLAGTNAAANTITTDAGVGATIDSVLAGSAGMTKAGTGTLRLGGANTYTGGTAVNGGTLVVDGNISNSTVTINDGGTLSGSGSVGGIVLNLGGTISPGNSPGTQNATTNVVWNGGGNYNWQVFNASGTKGSTNGWDWLNTSGSLNLSNLSVTNQFNINLWSLSGIAPDTNGSAIFFTNTSNYTWTILTASNGIAGFSADKFAINIFATNGTGGFANALGGGTFSVLQDGNNLNLVFTAVPEPGTWAAAALLVGGAAFLRWRRRK